MNKFLIPLMALLGAGCASYSSNSTGASSAGSSGTSGNVTPNGTIAPLSPPVDRSNDMRSQILAAHPEWSPEVQQFVKDGRLGQGMPEEAVKAAWGTAAEKISSNEGGVSKDEWVYKYPSDPKVYHLYFENGVLKSWKQAP